MDYPQQPTACAMTMWTWVSPRGGLELMWMHAYIYLGPRSEAAQRQCRVAAAAESRCRLGYDIV